MRYVTLFAAVSTLALASPAIAADHRGYVGIDAGLLMPHDTDFEYDGDDVFEAEHNNGYDLDLVGGYDFGWVRAEGELSWKRSGNDEIFDDACGLDWPNRVTGRALRNRFTAEWEGRREALRTKVATYPPFGHLMEIEGSSDTAINWAGESSGLVGDVRPAGEIVADVVAEAERRLRAAAAVLA